MMHRKTIILFSVSVLYVVLASVSLWWTVSQVHQLGAATLDRAQVIANAAAQEQEFTELNQLIETGAP